MLMVLIIMVMTMVVMVESVSDEKPILAFISEFLSFILMFQDENENISISVMYFKTRTKNLLLNLGLWDKNKNQGSKQFSSDFLRIRLFSCPWTDIFNNNKTKEKKKCSFFFSWKFNENPFFYEKNENSLLTILCFETRTRNRKWFLKVERDKMKLILMGVSKNENSCCCCWLWWWGWWGWWWGLWCLRGRWQRGWEGQEWKRLQFWTLSLILLPGSLHSSWTARKSGNVQSFRFSSEIFHADANADADADADAVTSILWYLTSYEGGRRWDGMWEKGDTVTGSSCKLAFNSSSLFSSSISSY